MKLSANFSLAELTRTSKPGVNNTPSEEQIANLKALAVNVLQPLRDAIGRPIKINSAFRSEAVNKSVGGSSSSQHCKGEAADIEIEGFPNIALARKIIELGLPFDQLIAEFLVDGDANAGWIHVSHKRSGAQRKQLLTATKSAGKTIYTDGLPKFK